VKINIQLSEIANLVNLINDVERPSVPFTELDFIFGTPTPIPGVPVTNPDVHNTQIVVSAAPQSSKRGSVTKTYHRVNLQVQWEKYNLPDTIKYLGNLNDKDALVRKIQELIPYRAASFTLKTEDLGNKLHKVVLTPIQDSLCYSAGLEFRINQEDTQQPPVQPIVSAKPPIVDSKMTSIVEFRPADNVTTKMVIEYYDKDTGEKVSATVVKETNNWRISDGSLTAVNAVTGVFATLEGKAKPLTSGKVTATSADTRGTPGVTTFEVKEQAYIPKVAAPVTVSKEEGKFPVKNGQNNKRIVLSYKLQNPTEGRQNAIIEKKEDNSWVITSQKGEVVTIVKGKADRIFEIDYRKLEPGTNVTITSYTGDNRDSETEVQSPQVPRETGAIQHAPAITSVSDGGANTTNIRIEPHPENKRMNATFRLKDESQNNDITVFEKELGVWGYEGKLPDQMYFNPANGALEIFQHFLEGNTRVVATGYDAKDGNSDAYESTFDASLVNPPTFTNNTDNPLVKVLKETGTRGYLRMEVKGSPNKVVIGVKPLGKTAYEELVLSTSTPGQEYKVIHPVKGVRIEPEPKQPGKSWTYKMYFDDVVESSSIYVQAFTNSSLARPSDKRSYQEPSVEDNKPEIVADAASAVWDEDARTVTVTPGVNNGLVEVKLHGQKSTITTSTYQNKQTHRGPMFDVGGSDTLNLRYTKDNGNWVVPNLSNEQRPYIDVRKGNGNDIVITYKETALGEDNADTTATITSRPEGNTETHKLVSKEVSSSHTFQRKGVQVAMKQVVDNLGTLRINIGNLEENKRIDEISIEGTKANNTPFKFTVRHNESGSISLVENIEGIEGVAYTVNEAGDVLTIDKSFTKPNSQYTVKVKPLFDIDTENVLTANLKHINVTSKTADKATVTLANEHVEITPGANNNTLVIDYTKANGTNDSVTFTKANNVWGTTGNTDFVVEGNKLKIAVNKVKDESTITVTAKVGTGDQNSVTTFAIPYKAITADKPTVISTEGNLVVTPGVNNTKVVVNYKGNDNSSQTASFVKSEAGTWTKDSGVNDIVVGLNNGNVVLNFPDTIIKDNSEVTVVGSTADDRDIPARVTITVGAPIVREHAHDLSFSAIHEKLYITPGQNNRKITLTFREKEKSENTVAVLTKEGAGWKGDVDKGVVWDNTKAAFAISRLNLKDDVDLTYVTSTTQPNDIDTNGTYNIPTLTVRDASGIQVVALTNDIGFKIKPHADATKLTLSLNAVGKELNLTKESDYLEPYAQALDLVFTKKDNTWQLPSMGSPELSIDNVGDIIVKPRKGDTDVSVSATVKVNEVRSYTNDEYLTNDTVTGNFSFEQRHTLNYGTHESIDGNLVVTLVDDAKLRYVKNMVFTGKTDEDADFTITVKRQAGKANDWEYTSNINTRGYVTFTKDVKGKRVLNLTRDFVKENSIVNVVVNPTVDTDTAFTGTITISADPIGPEANAVQFEEETIDNHAYVTLKPGEGNTKYTASFKDRTGKDNKVIWSKWSLTDELGIDLTMGLGTLDKRVVIDEKWVIIDKAKGIVKLRKDRMLDVANVEIITNAQEDSKRAKTATYTYTPVNSTESRDVTFDYRDSQKLTVGELTAPMFKVDTVLYGKPFTAIYKLNKATKAYVLESGEPIIEGENKDTFVDIENGNNRFIFRVYGAALKKNGGDDFNEIKVTTLDDGYLMDFNREIFYRKKESKYTVTSFDPYASESAQVREVGDKVYIDNFTSGMKLLDVTYTPKGEAKAKTVTYVRKEDGSWESKEATPLFSANSNLIEADINKFARPTKVSVAVYNGPRTIYRPAINEITLSKPIVIKAGEAVIREANHQVFIQLKEPVHKAVISWMVNSEKKVITLTKPFSIPESAGEYLESINENLITFKTNVIAEETDVTVRTETAKPTEDEASEVTTKLPYHPKPIGKAVVSDDDGTAVITIGQNTHHLSITYTSMNSGLSTVRLDKAGDGNWNIASYESAKGTFDTTNVSIDGNVIKLKEEDVMDNTKVSTVATSLRVEDGNAEHNLIIGHKAVTATPVTLNQKDGIVKITIPNLGNATRMTVNYYKPAVVIDGNGVADQAVFTRPESGEWTIPSSLGGVFVKSKDTENDTTVLTIQPESLHPNSEMQVKTETGRIGDIASTVKINVGEKPYIPKPVVAATLRSTNGDMGLVLKKNEWFGKAVITYYPTGETVPKSFTLIKANDDKLIVDTDSVANKPKGLYIDQMNNVYIPSYGIESETKVTVETHNLDKRDGTATAESRVTAYRPSTLPKPEINDAKGVFGIRAPANTGTMTLTTHVEGPSPFEDGGELTIKATYNTDTARWSLETNPKQPKANVELNETTGLIQIKQALLQDGSKIVITTTPLETRDTGGTHEHTLIAQEYPSVLPAKVTWNDDKTKLLINQDTPESTLYFTVKYMSNGDNAERSTQFTRSTYRGDLPYKAVTGNFGNFTDTTVPSGMEIVDNEKGQAGRTISINDTDLNMTSHGKSVIVTVISHGPNPNSEPTEISYKVNKKAIVAYKDGQETPLEPTISRDESRKVLVVNPADDDGATRVLDVTFVKKDGSTDSIGTKYDSTAKEWKFTKGEKHAFSLNKQTGEIILKEIKLLDESKVIVTATNGGVGITLRYAAAAIDAVNKENALIESGNSEPKPQAAGINLNNEGYSVIYPITSDENTKHMELMFYTTNPVTNGDPIEHYFNVNRLSEADQTESRKWELVEEAPAGMEFNTLQGSIKLSDSIVDRKANIVRVTTTNVKEETTVGFKPGQGKPVLTSKDGGVTITLPDDGISTTMTVSFLTYGDFTTEAIASAVKDSDGWRVLENVYGITGTKEGVITIPHHTAKEQSNVAVMLYSDAGGIARGPFNILVSNCKPLAKPMSLVKEGNEAVVRPDTNDAELTGYSVSYINEKEEDQTITASYNRQDNTWTINASDSNVVKDTTTGIVKIPVTKVKDGKDAQVTAYNTQNWGNTTSWRFTLTDAAHPIKEIVTVKPARMDSYRGNIYVSPQSANTEKMKITLSVPSELVV